MTGWRKVAVACLACWVALSAGACSDLRDTFGLSKRPPDEFTVMSKPPLVVPPDFSLRPPAAPATGSRSSMSAAGAKSALLGQARSTGAAPQADAKSAGEQALLSRAGAEKAAPGIREVILRETTQLENTDPSFAERLIFWRKTPPPGQAVDARKEAERLRRAAASGESPTSGETPVIRRRQRSLLEDIF